MSRAQGALTSAHLLVVFIGLHMGAVELNMRIEPAPPIAGRDPFLWPFDTYSPWNMPIGSGALFADIIQSPTTPWNLQTINAYINAGAWTIAVWKARSNDPIRTMTVVRYSWPNTDPANTNFCATGKGGSYQYQIPDYAVPSPPPYDPTRYASDATMIIVDPDGRIAHESNITRRDPYPDGPNWKSYDFAQFDLTANGWGMKSDSTTCYHGTSASGAPSLGGLIRAGELQNGIKHALRAIAGVGQVRAGARWPASASDGDATVGNVYESSLLAIPHSVNLDTLNFQTVQGKNIALALQQYGVYVVDSGSAPNTFIYMQEYSSRAEVPNTGTYSSPTAFGKDLRLAVKYLKVVTNNGPNSIGGGGTPLAPLAPRLSRPGYR